jgi:hypothetical protein
MAKGILSTGCRPLLAYALMIFDALNQRIDVDQPGKEIAGGGARTRTAIGPRRFKRLMSANSITPASAAANIGQELPIALDLS